MPTVLVVDDSAVDRKLVARVLLGGPPLEVQAVANGAEALAWIEGRMPDLVVTDLQMPQMDGLALVTTLRGLHPGLPVVLITAHGSEDLAIAALERGAASYVPKSQLVEKLLETVLQVLSRTSSERSYEQLAQCMRRAEFSFALGSDDSLVENLVDLVRQILVSVQECDATEEMRVGTALEEALHAAIFQGNLELDSLQAEQARMGREEGYEVALERRLEAPYSERKAYLDVQILPAEARFVVRHEGPARARPAEAPPSQGRLASLVASEDQSDRARVLIETFMDEVTYDATGRQVTMVKRVAAPSRQTARV